MGYQGTVHTFKDCEKSLPEASKRLHELRAVYSCDECGQTYRVYKWRDGSGMFGKGEVGWHWEEYKGYITLGI
jgi:hypothetical protein